MRWHLTSTNKDNYSQLVINSPSINAPTIYIALFSPVPSFIYFIFYKCIPSLNALLKIMYMVPREVQYNYKELTVLTLSKKTVSF
jgi:hypothetical protein